MLSECPFSEDILVRIFFGISCQQTTTTAGKSKTNMAIAEVGLLLHPLGAL